MQYLNKAYLLIGGNVGNRSGYLQQAIDILNAVCGKVINKSALYETAAWGKTDQPAFLNQALELETGFPAEKLMNEILVIEEQIGRKRSEKYGPRTIDIDILLFNEEVHDSPNLTVPHPELQNRRFALKPLADIGAHLHHPLLKKTVSALLEECQDKLQVTQVPAAFTVDEGQVT
jgi:2-amino-4-hydroxy-6-hydroxymethyldihydropteridine diphosphokinase